MDGRMVSYGATRRDISTVAGKFDFVFKIVRIVI